MALYVGAAVSTVIVKIAEASLVLPATSVMVVVMAVVLSLEPKSDLATLITSLKKVMALYLKH
jgi:hypothetical protein